MILSLAVQWAKNVSVKQYAFGFVTSELCLLLLILVTALPGHVLAQSGNQACAVVADTLDNARNAYTQYCSQPRKDCDPIDGSWYCSSGSINQSVKPSVVNGNSNQNTNLSSSSNSQAQQVASVDSSASNQNNNASGQGACIDTDGDGWGWNGASCRVTSNAATANANTPRASTPSASTSSASASSANTASDSSSATPSGSGPCIDTDGDGWGWNGASCKVSSGNQPNTQTGNSNSSNTSSSTAAYRAADITDLVLLTGQSNALGANTAYDASLDSPHPQVFAFTDTGWKRADLHQIWDRGWHPRNDPNTDPANNLLLHFGKRLVTRDSRRVVGFILVSAPGAAIANWDYNEEFYRRIDGRVIDAINQLPHKSGLDGVLWHQGETDANDTPEYENKLRALIANFRSENWFSSGKPFICGEIARRGGVNNRLNSLNSDSDAYTGCVSASGLATKIDGSHFTAEGLREIGKRYADRYYDMTR